MSDRVNIAADMLLSVTLPAQQWLAMQQLLGEGPYRLVQPLISEIQRQCLAQAGQQASSEIGIAPQRVNGGMAGMVRDA